MLQVLIKLGWFNLCIEQASGWKIRGSNSGWYSLLLCHTGSGPRRVSGGRLPKLKCLMLVVDRSRLSSNFMWWTGTTITGTAITSPLLGKRSDVYD